MSDPVEFESIDHFRQVLNATLSKAEDFEPVPTPRPECRVLTFDKGPKHQQYVNCPEQDCENLVYYVDQEKSVIETLELQEQMSGETESTGSIGGMTRCVPKVKSKH